MDRLGFFKQGLSSMLDAANSIIGLKHAVNTFTNVVDEALSNIKSDVGLHLPSLDAGMYDDPQGTLSEVANIGYTTLEIGSYYGGKIHNMEPAKFKALTNKAGLKITSAHINHLYEEVKGEMGADAELNSADAEAAKRAARWVANSRATTSTPVATTEAELVEKAAQMEVGQAEEGTSAEVGQAEKGTPAEVGQDEEGTSAEVGQAEEGTLAEVGQTEVAQAEKANCNDNAEVKADPNDEWWKEALDIHKGLGCRYIVMSRLPDYPTEEVAKKYATYFNRIAELAIERGMQFCYHPRQQELTQSNGKSVFETILANTDPEKVYFEIDTYEATEAGIDVIELLKRLTTRISLLHLHDYGIVGESEKIDFEKIIAQAVRTGVKDIYVEVRSFSLPPMNCVERSFLNVETLPSMNY